MLTHCLTLSLSPHENRNLHFQLEVVFSYCYTLSLPPHTEHNLDFQQIVLSPNISKSSASVSLYTLSVPLTDLQKLD